MSEMKEIEMNEDFCISTCTPTCEKGIYDNKKLNPSTGGKKKDMDNLVSDRLIEQINKSNDVEFKKEINIENGLEQVELDRTVQFKNFRPVDFLSSIESNVSKKLISFKKYEEIKGLAKNFHGNITSFFGFETRLKNNDATSDYLFAISSKKGEREALLSYLESHDFENETEWNNVKNFTQSWTDPKSILYDKIPGLWLEFDTSNNSINSYIPNIFLQVKPLRMDTDENIQTCKCLTNNALPLIIGRKISKIEEEKFFDCIKKLPKNASLIHVGTMLSRNNSGLRLVFKKIAVEQIKPYLDSIGWVDENNELDSILDELKRYASRIVLHIGIQENEVNKKIGIECSFSTDRYNEETGWENFLEYLVEKELCLTEKKSALLNFLGVEMENHSYDFNLEEFDRSVMLPDNNFSSALVRYISHVKISYEPNKPLEAKAYPGVRLFGKL